MSEAAGAKRARVVVDTNVLFSASIPGQAIFAALEHDLVLVSEDTVRELAEVLGRAKFDRYVTREERDRFLEALLRRVELVEVAETVTVCRDPRDDMLLSLALAGSATDIISGDDDLLVLHPFRGIRILRPRAFLDTVAE